MDAPRRRAAAARQQEAASGARPAAGEDASEAAAAAPRASPPTAPTTSAEPAPPRAYVEPPLQLLSAGGGDWLPHVDLSEGPRAFVVLVDLPSLAATDLSLSRVGARTRIRGGRRPPYREGAEELRGERLYGDFSLTVRVPDMYEKRWHEGKLANGVLRLSYSADDDED